jgi:hypothetical protein
VVRKPKKRAKMGQQLFGVGGVRVLKNWKEGTIGIERAVRGDRRSFGVTWSCTMSTHKNSLKILLTENGYANDTPIAPVSAFPPKNVPAFLSNPHAGNTVSEEYRCLHN